MKGVIHFLPVTLFSNLLSFCMRAGIDLHIFTVSYAEPI